MIRNGFSEYLVRPIDALFKRFMSAKTEEEEEDEDEEEESV